MAIIVRCPKCHRYRSLETDACDCGEDLKAARRENRAGYYIKIMVNGIRRRFSVGTRIGKARQEEARLLTEYADTGAVKSRLTITVDEYYRKFFLPEQKRKNKSWEKARSRYRNHLKPVFGLERMMAIGGHQVQNYINQRLETKDCNGRFPQPGTVNRELAVLKRMFNQAKGDGLFSGDNPVYGKSAGQEKNNFGAALSKRDAAALLDALPENNIGMLIEFLLATGLRFQNGARLRWRDIDLDNARLRAIETKTGPAGIPLSDWALDIVRRVHRIPGGEYVFPHIGGKYHGRPYGDIRESWKAALKKAGLGKFRIHDLRHTFGSWLGDGRISEKSIAALLNHKQTATTSRYTHPGDDALRDTVNAIQRPMVPGKPTSPGGAQSGAQSAKVIPLTKKRG